jgi:hypothetical protein
LRPIFRRLEAAIIAKSEESSPEAAFELHADDDAQQLLSDDEEVQTGAAKSLRSTVVRANESTRAQRL